MRTKLWVDDIRKPPDSSWCWAKTSEVALCLLKMSQLMGNYHVFTDMSLDHDLGGDDTSRRVVLWMIENEYWPANVRVHSANPVGVDYLEGMIERYHPSNAHKYNR